jgi:hypothetical protein
MPNLKQKAMVDYVLVIKGEEERSKAEVFETLKGIIAKQLPGANVEFKGVYK